MLTVEHLLLLTKSCRKCSDCHRYDNGVVLENTGIISVTIARFSFERKVYGYVKLMF